jgi:hypothetical protein
MSTRPQQGAKEPAATTDERRECPLHGELRFSECGWDFGPSERRRV